MRSTAWAWVLTVSTPNTIGTPVASAAAWSPRAASPATYSKCGVSPRITAPRQTTPSTVPLRARCCAISGSSNGAGHEHDRDVVGRDALRRERAPGAVEQPAGDVLVEPAHDHAEAHPRAVDRLGRCRVLTHRRVAPMSSRSSRYSTCGSPACSTSPSYANPSFSITRATRRLSTSVNETSASRPHVDEPDPRPPPRRLGRQSLAASGRPRCVQPTSTPPGPPVSVGVQQRSSRRARRSRRRRRSTARSRASSSARPSGRAASAHVARGRGGPPSVACTRGSANIPTRNSSSAAAGPGAATEAASVVNDSGGRRSTHALGLAADAEVEEVTHLLLLGPQVRDVLRVRRDLERHPLDDLEPEALEAAVLRRVVGHHPHRGDPEVDEDLRPDAVLARVGREAELLVRLDGVAALVLQRVRPQLVAEADAAALVPAQVHDHAATLGRDLRQRAVELQAAVAAHRAEHVAGEALAVHPDEHVRPRPATSPHTNAMCSTPSSRLSNTTAVKSPWRVGMRASLTRRTSFSRWRRYRIRSAMVMRCSPCSSAKAWSCGQPRHRAVVVHHLGEHARLGEARPCGRGRPRPRCGRRA